MQFNKPSTTVPDQLNLLISRGMSVADRARAERYLETVGYYRLGAYWLPFEQPPTPPAVRSKQFQPGTDFDAVVSLYVFDRHLRLLVMEAIERVEIAIRSRWTNRLSMAHGAHAHLTANQFKKPFDHARMISQAGGTVQQSNEVFIKHYLDKYNDPWLPPLWAVTETFTMGQLSKWVAATKENSVVSGVASDLGLPTRETLEGVLHVLCYVRNIAAHHGRLWNRRLVKFLPNIRRYRADLERATGQPNSVDNSVFNVLVVLLKLLEHQSTDTSFPGRLLTLLNERSDGDRRAMGFPADWRTRPIWTNINLGAGT